MKKNRRILYVTALASTLVLYGCSNSTEEATSIQNESIRASNCALIADWVIASDGPVVDWGNRNRFEIYSFKDEYIWSKMQMGDKSFDALLELRKLDYAQNYYTAPQLGQTLTSENDSNYANGGPVYNEDESWKIIEKVRASCPTFPKEYLADNFAAVLKYDSRYKK
jgi:hypothetical protein